MTDINPHTPLWQLTVGEFLEMQRQFYFNISKNKYEYGLKGLARILGCSRTRASEIKKSGILDDAIYQNGKIIVIDREKALELFKKNER